MKTETEPKHTPTPWKVFENSQSFKIGVDYANQKSHFLKGIAMARTPSKLPIDESNAAYIVRAVNAFEKLERIAHHATFEKCDKTNNCLHCMAQDFYAKAEAAQ